eukprot:224990-Prorocentrum_lima.AAC.1
MRRSKSHQHLARSYDNDCITTKRDNGSYSLTLNKTHTNPQQTWKHQQPWYREFDDSSKMAKQDGQPLHY